MRPGSSILSFSAGTLLLSGIPFDRLNEWLPRAGCVFDPRAGVCRCDALHLRQVVAELERRHIRFENQVAVPREVFWKAESLCELRPEQTAAVEAWLQADRRGCIVMPTGTGKTEVALRIMQLTRCSTLVVSPIRDLMYQWHRRILRSLNYDAGIIGDSIHRVQPVSVTTYDSACIHMPTLGDQFGLIIFDECHHLPGGIRRDAARMSAAGARLGLTATPERPDGRHEDLTELIGPIVYELSIAAVRGKTLADYDVVRIPVHLSASEQRRYDMLAEEVQTYVYQARQVNPGFTWEQLCMSSAVSGEARRPSVPSMGRSRLKTVP
ncbi:MAG: DEAD/DEAH box helicase [Planctomycetaceae bacterium]